MVRFAGQTPTMDNREELLDALNGWYTLFCRTTCLLLPIVNEQFTFDVFCFRFFTETTKRNSTTVGAVFEASGENRRDAVSSIISSHRHDLMGVVCIIFYLYWVIVTVSIN